MSYSIFYLCINHKYYYLTFIQEGLYYLSSISHLPISYLVEQNMKVCILKSINRPNQNHHGYDYSIIADGGGCGRGKKGGEIQGEKEYFSKPLLLAAYRRQSKV